MYARQDDVDAIKAELQALRSDMADVLRALSASGKTGTSAQPKSVEERLDNLESQQLVMQENLRDQGAAIGQIATRSGNNYHWRFDATSQPAVNEFKRAIAATIPSTGKFWVNNLTGSDQWIVINGKQERILAGAKDDFDVPVGPVTTRVPGEEAKTWYVGLPKYEYSIDLKSKPVIPIVTRVYEYPASLGWVAAY
jgi:hypothetical protein